jgi:hypothetical protein
MMTTEVKLPTAAALQVREVKPGLWSVVKSDEQQAYSFFEVSAVFQKRRITASSDSEVAVPAVSKS